MFVKKFVSVRGNFFSATNRYNHNSDEFESGGHFHTRPNRLLYFHIRTFMYVEVFPVFPTFILEAAA